jgi:hypothetical protein
MTLSLSKLNEIAALYESITASEQEQLDEDVKSFADRGGVLGALTGNAENRKSIRNAVGNTLSNINKGASNLMQTGGIAGAVKRQVTSARDAVQGKKPEPAKYKSSSDGKMYANYNDAKAARDSRLKSLAATQAAAKVTPEPKVKPEPKAESPAAKPQPKVVPTKPTTPAKPAMGITAGGTKFERRAATGTELAAARAARDAAKESGNTKGAEEAAVKAGVNASKPSTLKSATDAASKPAAFKPATINAASSTSASASGDTYKYKPSSSLMKNSFEYDAYDIVLEYLLSQGHAETVAEAQYLMTEMDAEMIGDIVEAVVSTTGQVNPPIKPGPMFPKAPNMGANRPYEDPFINPSGSRTLKGASNPVKKDTKTA